MLTPVGQMEQVDITTTLTALIIIITDTQPIPTGTWTEMAKRTALMTSTIELVGTAGHHLHLKHQTILFCEALFA